MGWGVHDYPTPPETVNPVCPVCGNECDYVFLNENGEVVFCDVCEEEQFWKRDAYEWMEERNER